MAEREHAGKTQQQVIGEHQQHHHEHRGAERQVLREHEVAGHRGGKPHELGGSPVVAVEDGIAWKMGHGVRPSGAGPTARRAATPSGRSAADRSGSRRTAGIGRSRSARSGRLAASHCAPALREDQQRGADRFQRGSGSHFAVAWPVTGGSVGDSTRRRGRTHRRRGHTGRRQLIEARERARESRDRQRFGPLADGDSAAP